ncbi:hypothetical protein B0W81_01910, partial [Prochlorococcus sp. HOT_208_60]
MFIPEKDFADLVAKTPLIALDLCIIKNKCMLLGKRLNSPAKNTFFVPGGRILKREKIDVAIKRILQEELNLKFKNNHFSISFIDVFEHFYDDNFQGNKNYDTHYVTLAYLIKDKDLIKENINPIKNQQHKEYIWYDIDSNENKNLNIHN